MRHIRHSSGGFTFIEIMISVTLLAMLMAAVGLAVQASMTNYRENEDMARAITTARQALMRITTDLRTASEVYSGNSADTCTIDLNGDADDAAVYANYDIAYQFDSATNTLNLIIDPHGAAETHVLCRNVTAMAFTRTAGADNEARNVRISMTVTIGDCSQTVSSAALIRRNL